MYMKQLFTVRINPNKEDDFKDHLIKKTKIEGLEEFIGEIFVPEDKVISSSAKNKTKKLYPGYAFVEIETNASNEIGQEVYYLIKNIKEFRGFIMSGNKPISMTDIERSKFEKIAKQAKDTGVLGTVYNIGDPIKVIDGPFANF